MGSGATESGEAPLVSVLVPVYQGEAHLTEALDSILAQSYERIEITVLDDGSTDGTADILRSYGDRISVHRNANNLGQFHNVNAGIAQARGELIAVYHADDIYAPTIVEREVEAFRRFPELGAVFALDVLMDAHARPYGRLSLPDELSGGAPILHATLLNCVLKYKNRHLIGPTSMVRRDVYTQVGDYREDLYGTGSDLDMWLRISREFPIAIVEQHLIGYRHFHGSESQRYRKLRVVPEDHFGILDRMLDEGGRSVATPTALRDHEAHRAEDWLMIGIHHYVLEDMDGARASVARCRIAALWGNSQVQWRRLIVLKIALGVLTRIPPIGAIAGAFRDRWGSHRTPQPYADSLDWTGRAPEPVVDR